MASIAREFTHPHFMKRPSDSLILRTVVANGQFPAPLISGNVGDRFKVPCISVLQSVQLLTQDCQINVIDKLTDPTMRRATSIVGHPHVRPF